MFVEFFSLATKYLIILFFKKKLFISHGEGSIDIFDREIGETQDEDADDFQFGGILNNDDIRLLRHSARQMMTSREIRPSEPLDILFKMFDVHFKSHLDHHPDQQERFHENDVAIGDKDANERSLIESSLFFSVSVSHSGYMLMIEIFREMVAVAEEGTVVLRGKEDQILKKRLFALIVGMSMRQSSAKSEYTPILRGCFDHLVCMDVGHERNNSGADVQKSIARGKKLIGLLTIVVQVMCSAMSGCSEQWIGRRTGDWLQWVKEARFEPADHIHIPALVVTINHIIGHLVILAYEHSKQTQRSAGKFRTNNEADRFVLDRVRHVFLTCLRHFFSQEGNGMIRDNCLYDLQRTILGQAMHPKERICCLEMVHDLFSEANISRDDSGQFGTFSMEIIDYTVENDVSVFRFLLSQVILADRIAEMRLSALSSKLVDMRSYLINIDNLRQMHYNSDTIRSETNGKDGSFFRIWDRRSC